MFPIIEEWERSSESREEFCNRHNLQLSTFSYWRTRYAKSTANPTPGFVQVDPGLDENLEVIYPNGVIIRLPGTSSLSQLQALIGLV